MKNPVIVALDMDEPSKAAALFDKLKGSVGGFKIGPRLTFRSDKSFLRDVSQAGIAFFDHKFFDIPSTTVSAVQAAAEMGADWVTVHALNGPVCLKDLGVLEGKIRKSNPKFKILAVTVLTSFNRDSLPPVWRDEEISQSVLRLATSAYDRDLKSFVCSPQEIAALKKDFPDSFLVVPGVRPVGSSSHDQQRVATPKEAIERGASALVVGRPVVEAADPVTAVQNILESLES